MNISVSAQSVIQTRKVQSALATISSLLHMTAYLFITPESDMTSITTVDYIVVGGGSAGCVIANRLSEDEDKTVLLLEAGDIPPMEGVLPKITYYIKNTSSDWNYSPENVDYNYLKDDVPLITTGKVLGGLTTVNYMSYIRGAPADYDAWGDLLNDDSWKYANLLKYFKKSEKFRDVKRLSKNDQKYHGTKGYIGVTQQYTDITSMFLEIAEELGINVKETVEGEQVLGFSRPSLTVADGIRQSTAYGYLSKKFETRSNLKVVTNVMVTKILFDDNKNAIGVEANYNDKTFTFYASNEVIVSAGAFNSPKLLMQSGIGPKDHLTDMKIDCISDLPVGQSLQDHPLVILAFNFENISYTNEPYNPHDFPAAMTFGSVALDNEAITPDYQVFNYFCNKELFKQVFSFSFGYKDEICDEYLKQIVVDNSQPVLTAITLVHPKSRGNVTLISANPTDKPKITLGRFAESEDLDNFVKYIEDFLKIVHSMFTKLPGVTLYPNFPDCDAEQGSTDYWRCYVQKMSNTFQSFAGTCAMGSVVDSKLNVKGVNKLRVADSSVIPIITSGGMGIPAVMIGERCAEIINGGNDSSDSDENESGNDSSDNDENGNDSSNSDESNNDTDKHDDENKCVCHKHHHN